MTKIFEALEYAGLERAGFGGTEDSSAEARQEPEISPARYPLADRSLTEARVAKVENVEDSIYRNVITLLPGRECRVIQFQGSHRGEGTSSMVRKLAALSAMKMQNDVLLVDLNREGPSQCGFFRVKSELPLSDPAARPKLTKEDFARVDGSSLYVTQLSGRASAADHIGEIVRLGDLLQELREEFDLILIDSPAASIGSEWILLAPEVDGVVLVVEAGKTRWQAVNKVKESILAQNGKILGVVLNKRRYPIPDFIYRRI